MSHWFHRNPIKATGAVSFDIRAASTVESRQICSDASLKRAKLLDLLCNPSLDRTLVEEGVRQYLSVLQGFIWEIAPDGSLLLTKDSKLRFAQKFKWVSSTDPNTKEPVILNDTMFELVSMLTNIGLWYTKHAACIAATKDNVSNDDAKQIHRALRTAAGIFLKVKEDYLGRVIDKPSVKGNDLDDQVLLAYATQAQAEAQEVTFAHAVEQQHNAGLVAALAYEAARLYQAADAALAGGIDEKRVGKWRKYLQFKQACYTAYAYSFEAEKRLAADECGYAIACVKEGGNWYLKGEVIAKSYASSSGVGTAGTKPLDHPFFRKLQPHLKRIFDKCERENTLIYHQKVPAEIPVLDLKPSFGLVTPDTFELPKCSEAWNDKVVNGFDLSKMSQTKDGTQKDDKEDVKPAKEKPIENTDREPQNESGCLLM